MSVDSFDWRHCKKTHSLSALPETHRRDNVFGDCPNLQKWIWFGGSQTAVTLHLEEWRNQMNDEFNHVNQVLPDTISREKNAEIQQ